jgi:hypothetical protein
MPLLLFASPAQALPPSKLEQRAENRNPSSFCSAQVLLKEPDITTKTPWPNRTPAVYSRPVPSLGASRCHRKILTPSCVRQTPSRRRTPRTGPAAWSSELPSAVIIILSKILLPRLFSSTRWWAHPGNCPYISCWDPSHFISSSVPHTIVKNLSSALVFVLMFIRTKADVELFRYQAIDGAPSKSTARLLSISTSEVRSWPHAHINLFWVQVSSSLACLMSESQAGHHMLYVASAWSWLQ